MLIALLPVIVLLVGLLLWILPDNVYIKEIGRMMVGVGILCLVLPHMNEVKRLF